MGIIGAVAGLMRIIGAVAGCRVDRVSIPTWNGPGSACAGEKQRHRRENTKEKVFSFTQEISSFPGLFAGESSNSGDYKLFQVGILNSI